MDCVKIEGGYFQGSTNIRKLRGVWFSLSKRKFIKPGRRYGDRVSGFYEYCLVPGTYLRFNFYCWTKAEPAIELSIEIVKLQKVEENDCYNISLLKQVFLKGDSKKELVELAKVNGLNVLEDFVNSTPGYHSLPMIKELSSKVYSDEEVKLLLDFIEKFDGVCLQDMERE